MAGKPRRRARQARRNASSPARPVRVCINTPEWHDYTPRTGGWRGGKSVATLHFSTLKEGKAFLELWARGNGATWVAYEGGWTESDDATYEMTTLFGSFYHGLPPLNATSASPGMGSATYGTIEAPAWMVQRG